MEANRSMFGETPNLETAVAKIDLLNVHSVSASIFLYQGCALLLARDCVPYTKATTNP